MESTGGVNAPRLLRRQTILRSKTLKEGKTADIKHPLLNHSHPFDLLGVSYARVLPNTTLLATPLCRQPRHSVVSVLIIAFRTLL